METEWLQWQQRIFIPILMETGYLTEQRFLKLLGHDDEQGLMYSLQLEVENDGLYEKSHNELQSMMDKHFSPMWNTKAIYFCTVMKKIS